jgi:hypothetical protein
MTLRQFARLALGFVVAVAVAAPAAAQPIERSLWVSVVDQSGAPVPGLTTTDFIVREDNVSREVLRVVPAEEPMQIALLVDTSQAVRNDVSNIRNALPAFLTALTAPNAAGRRNEVALVGFGDRPTILTESTSSTEILQKGVGKIFALPSAGPYLLDAIEESVKGFKKREAARPVIVAIAMETREYSYRTYEQVVTELKDGEVPLYALMIGRPYDSLRDEDRGRQIVLDRGTRDTGGERQQLLSSMALEGRLTKLADVLTHMYRVTYAHPDSLIPPEKVTVNAKNPELTARGTLVKGQDTSKRKP